MLTFLLQQQTGPSPTGFLPPWMQGAVMVISGLFALIVGMVYAAKRGVKLFSGGVTSTQFSGLDGKIDKVLELLVKVQTEIAVMDERLDQVERRLDRLENGWKRPNN